MWRVVEREEERFLERGEGQQERRMKMVVDRMARETKKSG